jgi:uncharacterized protein GlcG (DUF336 family)
MELSYAEKIVAASKEKAHEMGLPMCIAIMDEHAYLVAFIRTGDTTLDSIQIAIDKAYTAAMIRMDTRTLGRLCLPGNELYGFQNNLGGRLVIFPGGLPIFKNDKLLGSIGVSGGEVDEDEVIAKAGVDSFLISIDP